MWLFLQSTAVAAISSANMKTYALQYKTILIMILFVFVACRSGNSNQEAQEIGSQQNVPVPNANIEILDDILTEVREIGVETIPQNNCGGSAEVENQIEKNRTISHIIEVSGGIEVNANGQIGFAGTDVELGASIAAQLGYTYGTSESLSRSITVKARPLSYMEHEVRLQEIWKTGTAKVEVGNKELIVPFSIRDDFALELADSRFLACPNNVGESNVPLVACIVPDMMGLDQAAIEISMNSLGLTSIISSEFNNSIAPGLVISQNPDAGTRLEPCEGEVQFVISLGALPVASPTPNNEPGSSDSTTSLTSSPLIGTQWFSVQHPKAKDEVIEFFVDGTYFWEDIIYSELHPIAAGTYEFVDENTFEMVLRTKDDSYFYGIDTCIGNFLQDTLIIECGTDYLLRFFPFLP